VSSGLASAFRSGSGRGGWFRRVGWFRRGGLDEFLNALAAKHLALAFLLKSRAIAVAT